MHRPVVRRPATRSCHSSSPSSNMTAADQVSPFRARHMSIVELDISTAAGPQRLLANEAESPLVWLARRRGKNGRPMIEPVQLQAGERLRSDFTQAQMMPRTTASWDPSLAGRKGAADAGRLHVADVAIAARQRVRQALDKVGPEFAGLLVDVCCFLKGLEDAERERRWPPRSAKIVLQLGLDRLARHYGLGAVARGRPRPQTRSWAVEEGRSVT